jgi:hypothetical protein
MKREIILYTLLLLININICQLCSRINFSSDGVHSNEDLVKKGVTTSVWGEDATNPIIIGSSKKQDYIYILIENDEGTFDKENIHLEFDNQKYANSSFTLDKSKKQNSNLYEYAVRIIYHCNNYGGALINYKL